MMRSKVSRRDQVVEACFTMSMGIGYAGLHNRLGILVWQGLLLVRIKSYSRVDLQLDSITVVHKF
jgi:hypothetical protein